MEQGKYPRICAETQQMLRRKQRILKCPQTPPPPERSHPVTRPINIFLGHARPYTALLQREFLDIESSRGDGRGGAALISHTNCGILRVLAVHRLRTHAEFRPLLSCTLGVSFSDVASYAPPPPSPNNRLEPPPSFWPLPIVAGSGCLKCFSGTGAERWHGMAWHGLVGGRLQYR